IAQAVPFLTQAYNEISETIYCKLMFQTHLKEIVEDNYTWDFINNKVIINLTNIEGLIENKLNKNLSEGISLLGELTRVLKTCDLFEESGYMQFRRYFADISEECAWTVDAASRNIIKGSAWNDSINGTTGDDAINGMENDDIINGNAGNDALYGGDGYDTVSGGYGDDIIVGGNGDDKLYGDSGNDLLDGGSGRDYMEGGAGNDTYIFGRGCGQDTIYDYDSTAGNTDKILISDGVTASEVTLVRNGSSLVLGIKGTKDTLTVNSYFSSDYYKTEQIQFADGTVWDTEYIKGAVNIASEGNDNIQGYETRDVLSGLAGNDTIYGNGGDDTISG
ncbi:calcium-binding protein, partial [Ruminiclostridium sufflavum]|uniref:calcium-binding protein n=1 Tax=Ruminiclostridium sufflavum TaxID=396504 RepID=UPI001057A373